MSRAFLDQEPPVGYVAGIGRGAVGFTTSADTATDAPYLIDDALDGDEEGGLLGTSRDKEDEEADQIYAQIEQRLQNKRKTDDTPAEDVDIKGRFTDLKRNLAQISDFEWENLPEAGDLTRRNKRLNQLERSQQRFYAVPDSILSGGGAGGSGVSSTNFQSISEAREKLLGNQLDNLLPDTAKDVNDSYVAELEESTSNLGDIKKGRSILASLRKTEPNKSNSWIASARLEEQAKNYNAAKKLITQGCQVIPRNEDVWLESIRIHEKSADGIRLAKVLVTDALKFNNKSQKLWIRAFELENEADLMSRRRILMKGLEYLPSNTQLWKELVNLEEDSHDVKKLLTKAVELCPSEWDFWLTLISLSEYKEAKGILNSARKALHGYYRVWIAACKLEERENTSIDVAKLSKLMQKAFKEQDDSNQLSQGEWLDQASSSEDEGFLKTCNAIVVTTLAQEESTIYEWFALGNNYKETHPNTANFVYNYIVEQHPHSSESWMQLFSSLKQIQPISLPSLFDYYRRAIELNPSQEIFTLMFAKDTWILEGNVKAAREILRAATSSALSKSEQVWLARIKLECKNGEHDSALSISCELIQKMPHVSARVWYKHIHLQRYLKANDILDTCDVALEYFPESYKLYLQKAQILLCDNPQLARETASIGVKRCPNEQVQLWLFIASIDQKDKIIKARSTLDTALLQNPQSDLLWLAKINLEQNAKNLIDARQLANKALQKFPSSARLWVCYLKLIPKMSQRKNAFIDALKSTSNSAIILLNIGVFFWIDGKPAKAKSWFVRAMTSDKANGDCWCWMYNYTEKYEAEHLPQFLNSFKEQYDNINTGETWNIIHKTVENFEKSPLQILKLVSLQLKTESSLK